jgi:hypothetical protein
LDSSLFFLRKNATGDVLWTARYKDISEELGKVDDIMPMWDAKVLFLFDRKIGKDKIAAVDAMTGKLLWVSGKYQDVEDMDNVVYIPKLDAFAITTKKNLTMIKARCWPKAGLRGPRIFFLGGTVLKRKCRVHFGFRPSHWAERGKSWTHTPSFSRRSITHKAPSKRRCPCDIMWGNG